MVKKVGNQWCVLHAHPQKEGGKTDKPAGTPIKCWSISEYGEQGAKKRAVRMHQAILFSQGRIKE
jgi:hypothetical protein